MNATRVYQAGGVQLDDGHFASTLVDTTRKMYSMTSPAIGKHETGGPLGSPRDIEGGVAFDVQGGSIEVYAPNSSEPQGGVAFTLNGWAVTRRKLVSGQTQVQ